MIILGPLIPEGEPVGAGAAVGRREAWEPLPLEAGGIPLPPPKRSAMLADSSSKSGVKELGYRSASSRAKRIAL